MNAIIGSDWYQRRTGRRKEPLKEKKGGGAAAASSGIRRRKPGCLGNCRFARERLYTRWGEMRDRGLSEETCNTRKKKQVGNQENWNMAPKKNPTTSRLPATSEGNLKKGR